MIPGTSKILSKSGPGTLLIITKMLQEIQQKIWNHPGKILFLSIWDIKIFENFEICMSYVPDFFNLFSLFLGFSCEFLSIHLENNFTKLRN